MSKLIKVLCILAVSVLWAGSIEAKAIKKQKDKNSAAPVNTVLLDVRVMLQGSVASGGPAYITDSLVANGVLDPIWTGFVDQVTIELLDYQGNVVDSAIGVVKTSKEVLALDRVSLPEFSSAGTDKYYVKVTHRNHLSVMTAHPVLLNTSSPTVVNFTDITTNIYGGADQQISTPLGEAMIMGDATNDGIVDSDDRTQTWDDRNLVSTLLTGPSNSDLNFDGVVDASDRSIAWNNRNHQEAAFVPGPQPIILAAEFVEDLVPLGCTPSLPPYGWSTGRTYLLPDNAPIAGSLVVQGLIYDQTVSFPGQSTINLTLSRGDPFFPTPTPLMERIYFTAFQQQPSVQFEIWDSIDIGYNCQNYLIELSELASGTLVQLVDGTWYEFTYDVFVEHPTPPPPYPFTPIMFWLDITLHPYFP